MALRFRRSVKIAPGLTLNVGKKSAGLRVGPRGMGVSVNTKGQKRVSAGLPGTGLHYSQSIKASKVPVEPRDPPTFAAKLVGWAVVGGGIVALIAWLA